MITITLAKSADGVSGHARTSLGWNINFIPEECDMVDAVESLFVKIESLNITAAQEAAQQLEEKESIIRNKEIEISEKVKVIADQQEEITEKAEVVQTVKGNFLSALSVIEKSAPVEDLLSFAQHFPKWTDSIGEEFEKGRVFTHKDVLYRTNQKTVFAEQYEPGGEGLDALFSKIQLEQEVGGIITWFKPDAVNNYKLGDLVRTPDNRVWESTHETANVWSPYDVGDGTQVYSVVWKRREDLE